MPAREYQHFLVLLLFMVLAALISLPANASAPSIPVLPPGGAFAAQADSGLGFPSNIPVPPLWPVHAVLMVTGVTLSALAISSIYMKKKPRWAVYHRTLGIAGGAMMYSGFVVIAASIASVNGPQFPLPHTWVGLAVIILVTVSFGLAMTYIVSRELKKKVRTPHLWLGRTIITVEAIEVVMGLILVGLVSLAN